MPNQSLQHFSIHLANVFSCNDLIQHGTFVEIKYRTVGAIFFYFLIFFTILKILLFFSVCFLFHNFVCVCGVFEMRTNFNEMSCFIQLLDFIPVPICHVLIMFSIFTSSKSRYRSTLRFNIYSFTTQSRNKACLVC